MNRRTENRAVPRRTTKTFVDIGVEFGAAALGQKLKDIVRIVDLKQQRNPNEAFEVLETAKMETLERKDSKPNSAMMK